MKNIYDVSGIGMQSEMIPAGAEATGSVTTACGTSDHAVDNISTACGTSDHATGNISFGYRLSKENERMKSTLQALAVFAFLVLAVGGDIATSLL